MIQLTCANCKASLEVDDAFAGGVCRCQHCGTIQTVPSRGGGKGRPAAPGSSSAKPLYKKEGAAAAATTTGSTSSSRGTRKAAAAGTGLDELAQVVASSGLARGSLKRKPPAAPPKDDEFDALDMYHATRGGEDAVARKHRDDAIRSGQRPVPEAAE